MAHLAGATGTLSLETKLAQAEPARIRCGRYVAATRRVPSKQFRGAGLSVDFARYWDATVRRARRTHMTPATASNPPLTAILESRPKCALAWNDERASYADLLRRVFDWSRRMPEAGARVVLFSENCPEWVYCAYAAWAARAVLVPVDHMSTAEELAYVLGDCLPALVVCSRQNAPTVARALTTARHRAQVSVLDEDAAATAPATGDEAPDALLVDETELATIVYTSGTTGDPKGVMLSFGNLLANVRPVVRAGYFTPAARVLLLLPLHHVLPLAGSLMAPLFGGSTIVFATSLAGEELLAILKRHAVTAIVGVPRFYDLLHRALRERISASLVGRTLFALARRIRSHAFSHLVFGSVHRKFGGALQYLICGGAALSPDTAETFDTLGFQMCEGFGMTECAPMITFPRPGRVRLGTCGQALDGCEVRIDESGEILARGPNVMQGYYGRSAETSAIVRDGWLHTGDLGRLDEDGYLFVTGRLKEILVLASGKKVNPATIEAALQSAGPAVREVGVFLDSDALHALIVPNWEALPMTDRSAAETWLRREVLATYNATVSPYRRVARLTLTGEDLPRTRLGKLRRHLLHSIAERIAQASAEPARAEAAGDSVVARLAAFFKRQHDRPVQAATRLEADLAVDSLGRVELSVFVERAFGIVLPETRLAEFETVGDLARFIAQYKKDGETPAEISWAEILHPKTRQALPSSSLYHRVLVHLSRIAVRAFFRVKARGSEHLPSEPFILAPNHQSYLDGLFVSAYMRPRAVLRTLFYAKERHVRRWWLKFLARRSNTIVMDPREGFLGSLQKLAAGLKRGNNLMIFPEGTRSRDGSLGTFKDSYAILARELGVPVVPVAISGAHAVLPAGGRLPRFLRRISITYLEAVRPGADEQPATFNARVRALIQKALDPAGTRAGP
jgi:long-chain acyl-CoA synthetase